MCGERHDPKFQTQPLSFSSCRRMLIPPLPCSHIPMAASVVQVLAGCVSIMCVCWAGVAWSLFIPGSQLTHEVMVVTLSVRSAQLIPFVLCRSFTDASGVLMMVSDGMWPCVRAGHSSCPPLTVVSALRERRSRRWGWRDADIRDCYASLLVLET